MSAAGAFGTINGGQSDRSIYYLLRGARLLGRPSDEIWYFAYDANMHDGAFRIRRGNQPLECCPGHIKGHQPRFNLQGRPRVANQMIFADPPI
jgi:hypothetical protein